MLCFPAQGFADGKYKKIMELLNKDAHKMKEINMSGMSTCLLSPIESQEWIIDSGATHHVTTNKSVFSKNQEVRDNVHLSTGAKEDISNIGETFAFKDAIVKDVLLVPDIKFNVLSISKKEDYTFSKVHIE